MSCSQITFIRHHHWQNSCCKIIRICVVQSNTIESTMPFSKLVCLKCLLASIEPSKIKLTNSQVVFMLSTAHPAEMNATEKNDREGNAVHKPTMIRAYNVHMVGVDRVDQQLHSIHLLQKSYKWYKKLVLHLISQVILNGHKIFQKHTGYTGDFLSFLHIIITELLLSTPKLNLNKNIHIPDTILRLTVV